MTKTGLDMFWMVEHPYCEDSREKLSVASFQLVERMFSRNNDGYWVSKSVKQKSVRKACSRCLYFLPYFEL